MLYSLRPIRPTCPRGRAGVLPFVSDASSSGFGPAFRGVVFVLFRLRPRMFRLPALRFCVGFGRCFLLFSALRLASGVIAVAVVSHRIFGLAFGVGSSCVR